MSVWYLDDIDRYQREIQALKSALIEVTEDTGAKAQEFLRLHLQVTVKSKLQKIPAKFLPLNLTVVFPEKYPFFRPDIYAPELDLNRHQNLVGKNLCLIPRSTAYWMPEDLLADFLNEQLWKVLTEGEVSDAETLKNNPDEQAEPASEYYSCLTNAPVLLDTSQYDAIPIDESKTIKFVGTVGIGRMSDEIFPSPLIVVESFDSNRQSIGKVSAKIENMFPQEIVGSIYQLAHRPPNADADLDFDWLNETLTQENDKLYGRRAVSIFQGFAEINHIVGLTFPEEKKAGVIGRGWLFIISFTKYDVINKKKVGRVIRYYAKVNRISEEELSFRIPKLKPLANKKIAIVGLGALGAPTAIEFARNNIFELRLADHDYVDAGTIVRWPLGISSAGKFKTDALKDFIETNYPFTNITTHNFKIGDLSFGIAGTPSDGHVSESQKIDELFENVSLIFDATAETGINHFLSEEAKKRKIIYVSIYATPGVWGGVAMRVIPNKTEGCWMCLEYWLADKTIPTPAFDPQGNMQAVGCGDTSFTGTSFELQVIVNAGVRLAISSLCIDEAEGYPNFISDVGVVSLVDRASNPIFPQWVEYKLNKHPNCPYCGSAG